MSFQAYLRHIESSTGHSAAELRALAEARGFTEGGAVRRGVTATQVVEWLHDDFGLGRGHAMAVWALLTGKKTESSV